MNMASWDIREGEASAELSAMPSGYVHCVVTSPPYWGQRDYGLGEWLGGDPECDHAHRQTETLSGLDGGTKTNDHSHDAWSGGVCGRCGARQTETGIGQEPTLTEHIGNLVAVLREVRRVLRDDGTVWLNYGDAYTSGGRATYRSGASENKGHEVQNDQERPDTPNGLKAKDLMGLPWRVAFALQDDGWWLRSAIVWHKPSPMPESVRDRPTSAYEMIFLLAKRPRYFYDAEAIRDFSGDGWHGKSEPARAPEMAERQGAAVDPKSQRSGANARNVWTFPSKGLAEPHYAAFPPELPRRCILAGTSEHGVCADCGAPWERVVDSSESPHDGSTASAYAKGSNANRLALARQAARERGGEYVQRRETVGWQSTCDHDADVIPATVLDPFSGSGTTGIVALQQGRSYVGIELNPEYVEMSRNRIRKAAPPMFSKEGSEA